MKLICNMYGDYTVKLLPLVLPVVNELKSILEQTGDT